MTYPSAGCETCKSRRIKCDETKPTCKRCKKSRRVCLWGQSTDQTYFSIHNENRYASGNTKRPRGPRSALTGTHHHHHHHHHHQHSSNTPQQGQQLQQYRSLHIDLSTRALVYYLHYYLAKPYAQDTVPSISRGLHDHLGSWLSGTKHCNPLVDLAISSMALAVFARTQHHPPAAIEASAKYQRLLAMMRTSISSPNLVDDAKNIDDCLLAIFFMSRFEDSNHCRFDMAHGNGKVMRLADYSPNSYAHHDGALAILKIWKEHHCPHQYLAHSQSPKQAAPSEIIKYLRRGMIRSAVLRHLALPEWLWEGRWYGEKGLDLGYDRAIVRIVNLRRELAVLVQRQSHTQTLSHEMLLAADKLNDEARDIDTELHEWTSRFPRAWSYQKHTLTATDPHLGDGNSRNGEKEHFYSSTVYSYASPAHPAAWILYFATRMLINNARLKILGLLLCPQRRQPTPHSNLEGESDAYEYEKQRQECLSRLNATADDLASSIPFILERFKVKEKDDTGSSDYSDQNQIIFNTDKEIKPYLATLAAWPLSIASCLDGLDLKQRLWFGSELASIGRILGVGVFEFAVTDQWLKL
ncbi:uncharacterized protein Z518_08439 [Rhinocladiella mackenziei CBS 650.93]|uniref:Rhinocladiella mackenziei CBS 650.93 unplaced genomic scaffold supercont1.6, whole genome shotgun sequence n=1 Tax=Rhinocladiella mackenziei CBS 650.93 TaxID=1442369 RepID=A0A0D2GWA4_9EURO|nr:uncharacterized protein Z518_08439 [Rhinocladiella mackenziei CBS 650.93]KIX02498.1 hypothetical protein Z518_08439 [Rhinocladiella mackenziei CBS 650.93]